MVPRRRRHALLWSNLLVALAFCWSCGGDAPESVLAYGPFEIVTSPRRVSTGAWPNQGGSPFATREVTDFQVRWRGRTVTAPDGSDRFWRVLRLDGAPRPALPLVTKGFVLATERDGDLELLPLKAESNALAEVQWLDGKQGQPGAPMSFGIERADINQDTLLTGGRWLRLGSRIVIDVPTLTVHTVTPWVPHEPGVPITSVRAMGRCAPSRQDAPSMSSPPRATTMPVTARWRTGCSSSTSRAASPMSCASIASVCASGRSPTWMHRGSSITSPGRPAQRARAPRCAQRLQALALAWPADRDQPGPVGVPHPPDGRSLPRGHAEDRCGSPRCADPVHDDGFEMRLDDCTFDARPSDATAVPTIIASPCGPRSTRSLRGRAVATPSRGLPPRSTRSWRAGATTA